jgi:hypothetical protein
LKLQRAEFTGTFREATQFPRERKKNDKIIKQSNWQWYITMHKFAEIASYPGNPSTYAPIIAFNGMFLSVPNHYWLCSVHKIAISRPPGPHALSLAAAWVCTHLALDASLAPELQLPAG